MGSGASTKLTCPMGDNKENFNKILKLYDQLDVNGDQSVESTELNKIANLHVKNRIMLIKQDKVEQTRQHNLKMLQMDEQINTFNGMSQKEKNVLFSRTVSGGENNIEFWKFYNYMKNRTNDIENL